MSYNQCHTAETRYPCFALSFCRFCQIHFAEKDLMRLGHTGHDMMTFHSSQTSSAHVAHIIPISHILPNFSHLLVFGSHSPPERRTTLYQRSPRPNGPVSGAGTQSSEDLVLLSGVSLATAATSINGVSFSPKRRGAGQAVT